jgi:multiple sugar transport system permease protein
MTFIAVSLALLLGSTRPRVAKVFRSIFFIPYAVPGVIAAIMWASLYQPATSPLNDIGIDLPLTGSALILPSIANIGIWGWAGFNMILMISALSSIPEELLEAAKIDGASELRIALSIKLPLIRPTIIMSATFSIIGTLQLFTEPTVLRSISNAISSAFTPNMLAYSHAVGNQYSYAAAVSVTLAVITFVMSFGFLRIVRRTSQS